jgi:uncharacterized membrane protein YcaP (DUF421 family)
MDIVLRAALAYVFIVFMLRIVGRRELSSLGPTDLILLVVMGDLIQNGVTQSDYSLTGIFLAVATIGMLTVATSFIVFKSPLAQRVIEGVPLILVEDGKPIAKNLKSERLTVGDLAEEMRGQGIESFDEVKWCVLEGQSC